MSSRFGRVSDFDETLEACHDVLPPGVEFDREKAGPPKKDPWFGTYYWIQDISPALIQEWNDLVAPQMPPKDSGLNLPPKNPFVPSKFDLKPTPPEDTHHPLLNCSLKLGIVVGKQKVGCIG